MSQMLPLCYACRHYKKDAQKDRPEQTDWPFYEFCAAYPDGDGIPLSVFMQGHFRPKDGDHGIQYSPAEGISESTIEALKFVYDDEDAEYVPIPEGMYV